MESSLKLIADLLDDLRDAGILEYEFVSPQLASQVEPKRVEKAIQDFAGKLKASLEEKPRRCTIEDDFFEFQSPPPVPIRV